MSKRFDLAILNGVVVTASDVGKFDIGVKDGKIALLAPKIDPNDATEVVDAEGAFVTPGGVDPHVHLSANFDSAPDATSGGGECADNFETGSRSAVCGGTTTMIVFATQTRKDKSLLEAVEKFDKRAREEGSYIDWGYHLIMARSDEDVMAAEMPVLVSKWGVTSVKLFMTYETLRLKDRELLDVMMHAKANKITTMIHAENGDLIDWLTGKLTEKGMLDPYYHSQARIPIAEGEATSRAIVLAELVQSPILFVHVSASSAMQAIRSAQSRGLPIHAETCPQYLHLTWEDLRRFHHPQCFHNSKMICSPPPGPDNSDQEALWTGLANGTFTIFSSDHCPFRFNDPKGKMLGILDHKASMEGQDDCDHEHLEEFAEGKVGHFAYVPNGCPGIETRVPLIFNYGVLAGRITPERFVELTSTAPAKLYGCYPQKGALLPGLSDADLTIWYPQGKMKPFKLENSMLHHDVDYSPYEGMEFANWPRYTVLRGKVVWREGELVGAKSDGEYVHRAPSYFKTRVTGAAADPRRVASWLFE